MIPQLPIKMNEYDVYQEQNLYDLSKYQEVNTSTRRLFDFSIFQQTRKIRDAVSSLGSKLCKAVKSSENEAGNDIDEVSFEELAEFVTKDKDLWNDFRTELIDSNVITNTAVVCFLIRYISERRSDLESKYREAPITDKQDDDRSTSSSKVPPKELSRFAIIIGFD